MLQNSDKVLLREADNSDLEAMARVQARAMVASDSYEQSTDEELEYRRLLSRIVAYYNGTHHPKYALAERTMKIAEHLDKIIGFVAGQRSTRMGCNGELQWLFVLPEWQKKGVGALLLETIREWFKKQNSTKVIVDAPPDNPFRDFYLKHGAVPLDEYWLYWEDISLKKSAQN